MNRFYILLILISFCQFSLAQDVNQLSTDERGREMLLGDITKEGLTSNSFNDWFAENYEAYTPDASVIDKLKRKLKKYQITVFMGTWCGDSKREVPRFFKLLEAANFPEEKLRVIGVHNARSQYKQAPNGEEKGKNIHRVPTFIVYNKRGKEVGRIVEHPVESLEADLLKICRKKSYQHNYQIVTKLHQLFEKKGTKYILENPESILKKLQPYSQSLKELNTYGHVLLYAEEMDKAIATFTLNTQLFPTDKKSFTSLAAAYFMANDYENAATYYSKVLTLDANDEKAKMMLAKMEK
ncbi:MAG: thioredoxin family protein [Bacteroidota bacterium]